MTVDQSMGRTSLDELRAAYQARLDQIAAERDEALRQARRARAEAVTARADLATINTKLQELLKVAGMRPA
ncbi:hypothetical protein [Actinomadura macrotermitis]|uniref:Uncharacterized protein n=1 Tax=Actinomadura macrotermitis TaxID=2585200 RepID=A0A7K0BNT5_9ACTN|nr:hypothetical protein [Actinomadura macrotermitis]MQY02859.1 hypothetical protein [Actinomadura macrotermitis]